MLTDIEGYVRQGFAIHWLHPKSKRPIGDNWSTAPIASLNRLKRTYVEGNNVGVRLGKWSKIGDYFLHVIDLDIRDAEQAEAARTRLAELFPAVRTFPTVISGSGGASRHFYILSREAFPSKKLAHSTAKLQTADGKWHWAWEIELFGTGKQVAFPPSIHPDTGNPYRWERPWDADDVDLGVGPIVSTEHLAELTGDKREEEQEPDTERVAPLGLSAAEIKDVLDDLPTDYWRDDRDGWLAAGFALHHETGGSDAGYKLWADFSKGSEKFDAEDQRRVWKSFKTQGVRKPLRMATLVSAAREARVAAELDELDDLDQPAPEVSDGALDEFDDVLGPSGNSPREQKLKKAEVEAALGHVPPKIKRLNRKHAVTFIRGKTVVITENEDGSTSYGKPSEIHQWYENDRVSTDKSTEPVSKAWMRHKMRREFPNGVVFAPGKEVPGAYNHWRGWSVEPSAAGSCVLWVNHLRDVICSGDEDLFWYALRWFAHIVQRPWEKPGVAMILRGKKRIGKDTIMDYFAQTCLRHRVKIANQEQLTGRFNAHQEKTLILHVEEGFWAGSKQAEGSLKHLVTSEEVLIEPKGIDAFSVTSVLRLFISSNEEWVVPASNDEGRYFVLDVSEIHRNDHPYFAALHHEMENGGPAALLHFLMSIDLSDFEVRKVPNTKALGDQKMKGLRSFDRYWFEMLESGEMAAEHYSLNGGKGNWSIAPIRVSRKELQDRYKRWIEPRRFDGDSLCEAEIGKKLKLVLRSDLKMMQPMTSGGHQERAYVIPSLAECRDAFGKYMGADIDWPDADEGDVEPFDDLDY